MEPYMKDLCINKLMYRNMPWLNKLIKVMIKERITDIVLIFYYCISNVRHNKINIIIFSIWLSYCFTNYFLYRNWNILMLNASHSDTKF